MTLPEALEVHRTAGHLIANTLRRLFPPGSRVKCYARHGTTERIEGTVRLIFNADGEVGLLVESSSRARFRVNPHRFDIERQPV